MNHIACWLPLSNCLTRILIRSCSALRRIDIVLVMFGQLTVVALLVAQTRLSHRPVIPRRAQVDRFRRSYVFSHQHSCSIRWVRLLQLVPQLSDLLGSHPELEPHDRTLLQAESIGLAQRVEGWEGHRPVHVLKLTGCLKIEYAHLFLLWALAEAMSLSAWRLLTCVFRCDAVCLDVELLWACRPRLVLNDRAVSFFMFNVLYFVTVHFAL